MSRPLPLSYDGHEIRDAERNNCDAACAPFYRSADPIRRMERASIRWWMAAQREYLTGRVLDYGAGKPGTCYEPQPYRDLVAGHYEPYDKGDRLPSGYFDAVMMTQTIQYLEYPERVLQMLLCYLKPNGHLLITAPGSWCEFETSDLWRFTRAGAETLVRNAGFSVLKCEERAEVTVGAFGFSLGFGLLAVRR